MIKKLYYTYDQFDPCSTILGLSSFALLLVFRKIKMKYFP